MMQIHPKMNTLRVLTILFIDFSDTQGQLTQSLVMGSGRYSKSSKLLWLSLLPARINTIQSKKKEGTRVLTALYIDFSDARGQLTQLLVMGPDRNLNSSKL